MIEILLVEDNPGDVDLVRESLDGERVRIELIVARDGQQALDRLRASAANRTLPALVLLDLNLPGKDGRQVLAEIKNDPNLALLPVVVLTSSEDPTDVSTSYKLGANCYVTKPVDFTRFRAVVEMIEHFWLSFVALPAELQPRR